MLVNLQMYFSLIMLVSTQKFCEGCFSLALSNIKFNLYHPHSIF